MKKYYFVIFLFTLYGCTSKSDTLFEKLEVEDTHIDFINKIEETDQDNVLNYEYFYNGGGVAAADFNNDGLVDLYFTANQGTDKIYINKSVTDDKSIKFEDATETSGIEWNGEWKTGVTIVDINNDGWQDIYVSVSANINNPALRSNTLYNNQGKSDKVRFIEKAAEYGLDLKSYSTQTVFFDFDKDGDLDAYSLNHNVKDFKRFDVEAVHAMRDSLAGDKLLENIKGKFVDISVKAGIKGNPIGFGLGIHTADINGDGWTDIYVSNDYLEEDYLYINNQKGGFTDEIKNMTNHVSYFSMGNDIGDVNNDLIPDIVSTDMLPEDNKRQKLLFGPDKYEAYLSMLKNGIHPSFMRNMLQLGQRNGATTNFAEIGQLSGISNTDWSWSVLLADYDNDGYKDLFVTNGYLRDYTNMDFIKYYAHEEQQNNQNMMDIIKKMPSTQTPNYIFKNEHSPNSTAPMFTNKQKDWGFEKAMISNGAVYADLDNDGDLEIITNNINEPASVYKNLSVEKKLGNFLKIQLNSTTNNQKKSGAKVYVFAQNLQQVQEFTPTHGYQSGIMTPLHFGLGKNTKIDSLIIVWNDGKIQKQNNFKANQTVHIQYAPNHTTFNIATPKPLFTETNTLAFDHFQMPFNDFNKQLLLPQMYSFQGPRMAKGDVNKDGLEDIYIGGGKGQAGQIYIQQRNGSFIQKPQSEFLQDELCTDTDAVFVDVEADGDLDLYITSGGYEYLPNDLLLQNRLYLNDGKGNFSKTFDAFDDNPYADSNVETIDYDHDGDLDLFVAGSIIPQSFPLHNPSRLYQNDKGKFTKIENKVFQELGILNDAVVVDFNKDGWQDIIAVGEWTGIIFLQNTKGVFSKVNQEPSQMTGMWQRIKAADFDNDGYMDLIVSNYGLNSQLKATNKQPLSLNFEDFDDNGTIDPILSYYIQGKNYPAYSRDELSDQLVSLKKKYTSYELYSTATTDDILNQFKGKTGKKFEISTLETIYLENKKGIFILKSLPLEAQFSPIYSIFCDDVNDDGFKDLILAGNQSHARMRLGNIDANYGQIFLNDRKGNFKYHSNLGIKGDVRDIQMINNQLFVGINNKKVRVFKRN
jgi:hypothetical protein